jgi:hypothetical protein
LNVPKDNVSKAKQKVEYQLKDLLYEVTSNHHTFMNIHKSTDYIINMNKITTNDARLTFLQEIDEETTFLDIEKHIEFIYKTQPPNGYHDEAIRLHVIKFYVSDILKEHFREGYTLNEALGDFGGLVEAIMVIFSFLVTPLYFKLHEILIFQHVITQVKLERFFMLKWFLPDYFCCKKTKKFHE